MVSSHLEFNLACVEAALWLFINRRLTHFFIPTHAAAFSNLPSSYPPRGGDLHDQASFIRLN